MRVSKLTPQSPHSVTPERDTHSLIQRAIVDMRQAYGPQGWWPIRTEARHFKRRSGELERRGYHPGQFEFPRTKAGRWEITCGAVLTQNTAWTNVEHAMDGLNEAGLRSARAILECSPDALGAAIRPAGYFNQKAVYLAAVAQWFLAQDRALSRVTPTRAILLAVRPQLLNVKGVGPETADSILLYAYKMPTFVVDAYTRRVFGRVGIIDERSRYEQIRSQFEAALVTSDAVTTVEAWQEAHALIVAHAKRFHTRTANLEADFLLRLASVQTKRAAFECGAR
ncbi:MAG TPA: hypothetical protein VIV60_02050 [Polyangiaceae bacterium]